MTNVTILTCIMAPCILDHVPHGLSDKCMAQTNPSPGMARKQLGSRDFGGETKLVIGLLGDRLGGSEPHSGQFFTYRGKSARVTTLPMAALAGRGDCVFIRDLNGLVLQDAYQINAPE